MTEYPHRHPVSRRASTLLNRADALLSESVGAGPPADRFHCAYLAALRGAGAVLAATEGAGGSAGRRGGSRNAWVLLARVTPEFEGWADYFAAWSPTRAAIEVGLAGSVDESDANSFHREVGEFLHRVEDFIGLAGRIDLRAS